MTQTRNMVSDEQFIRMGKTEGFFQHIPLLQEEHVVLVGCTCKEEVIEDVLRHQKEWGRVVHPLLVAGGPFPLAAAFYNEDRTNRHLLVDRINDAIDKTNAGRVHLLGHQLCCIAACMFWSADYMLRRLVVGKHYGQMEFPECDVEVEFAVVHNKTHIRTYQLNDRHHLVSPTLYPRE